MAPKCTITNLYSSKHYHWDKKTKHLSRTTIFAKWLFYVFYNDHLPKMISFEWSQEWLSYTGLTVNS